MTAQPIDSVVTHHDAVVNGVRLHYVEAGSGPLVVLLHGFPEFWYGWRRQIPALVDAGYRVIAPDLRGYGASEKPSGVASYDVETIAADVAALIAACGAGEAHVVGHDWGAAVAWVLAMRHPERVARLAILAGPHPESFARAWRDPVQLVRSWYIAFFQLPWLPELALRAGRFDAVRRAFRRTATRAQCSDVDLDRYVQALLVPGALTAALHWYRALGRRLARGPRITSDPVRAPVLVIWGARDSYLGAALADPGRRWAPDARVEYLEGVGHFLQWEAPERVNALLLEFLGGGAGSR